MNNEAWEQYRISEWKRLHPETRSNPLGLTDTQLRFQRHYGTPEVTQAIAAWDKAQTEKIVGFLGSWFIILLFVLKLAVMTLVGTLLAGAPGLAAPVIGFVAFFLIRGMLRR